MNNSESKHSLILIAVNPGYTDQIMHVAKQVGATGGTVIRARLAGVKLMEQFSDAPMEEEKEIVAILVPNSICNQIMENVNLHFGMRSDAKGIICAVPVEKAFKI